LHDLLHWKWFFEVVAANLARDGPEIGMAPAPPLDIVIDRGAFDGKGSRRP
jgi:hypothetical protein